MRRLRAAGRRSHGVGAVAAVAAVRSAGAGVGAVLLPRHRHPVDVHHPAPFHDVF